MKINNISITSHTALDFEINVAKPITILRGKHSALALDLMWGCLSGRGIFTVYPCRWPF